IAALNDPDQRAAEAAAMALGSLRAAASPAIGPLLRAASDPARPLIEAVRAMGDVGGDAVPALLQVLHSDRPAFRTVALQELAKLAPQSADAAEAVAPLLNDPERIARRAAIDAVDCIIRDPQRRRDLFVRFLRVEPDPWLRYVAIMSFEHHPLDERIPVLVLA